MNPIKQLQHECTEMMCVLRELAVLEDYCDADYSDVVTDVKWNRVMLENRLKNLRLRK
jgi:hypothetical protein